MIKTLGHYFSLVTFAHTIFALPFAIIGFFIATKLHDYSMNWTIFIFVILCMVFARNAAMGFNRWADRKIDAQNPRTAGREIPNGTISSQNGLIFTLINAILFITTTWFINSLCFWLSPVAIIVIMGYSLTKRFTALCHFILGLGLSLARIGAYLAIAGEFHWLPLIFSAIVFTWVSGFDIIFALQDHEFDSDANLFSAPVWLGKAKALRLSAGIHVITALLVILAGILAKFGWFYLLGSVLFITLLIYQHVIVKPDDLSKVNRAFGTTNGTASVVFAAFVLLELFL
ncbi:MAG: putative 4-hydroxybenzoate polyprenyltransferase [Bacteroidales bacterium]|nr:putative 4-hydroxybenzoate polyprenyltransferase [Bacteroidales bacterium]